MINNQTQIILKIMLFSCSVKKANTSQLWLCRGAEFVLLVRMAK